MKPIIRTIIILTFLLFSITSCSKGSSSPVLPDNTGATGPPALRMASGRNLLGVYEIHLRSDVPGADVRINRTIQSHVNAEPWDDVGVAVVVIQPPNENSINDYNPYFGFRGWAIWRLTFTLINYTGVALYDVRGIIKTDGTTLGLHNADGLTTAWDDQGDPNPFKYYGDLGPDYPDNDGTHEFQVEFKPPETSLNCEDCTWPSDIESSNPGGGAWDPLVILGEEWVNFAVDASIEDDCKDPYSITASQSPTAPPLYYPSIALTVNAYVHDEPLNYVEYVSIVELDLPGGPWDLPLPLSQNGDNWEIVLNIEENLTHEGIYHGRIAATSYYPNDPDPYDDPNIMYKDILLRVGDLDGMIDDLFVIPPEDLDDIIDEIKGEWNDTYRKEGIYHETTSDGFYIENYYDGESLVVYLLIRYNVWDPTAQPPGPMPEYGVLRIPMSWDFKPDDGYPLMVFCHWGKFVCHTGATDGFGFYDPDYKWQFAELIPKYRGNPLCFNGTQYGSDDGKNSPADWDVDDVLAFLNVVIDNELDIEKYPEVNYNFDPGTLLDDLKVGIMGGSRGGSPTYLAKIRDSFYEKNQINRAIVTIGSVTDFFLSETACGEYIEHDGYVPESHYHYYLEDYNVFARVLEPYLDGEFPGYTHDDVLKEARKRMVRSSPIYFTNYLTNIQAHHGYEDVSCRVTHSEEMAAALPYVDNTYEICLYLNEGHAIGPDAENYIPFSWQEKHKYPIWIQGWFNKIISGE